MERVYVGVNGAPKPVTAAYVGVNGKPRPVTAIYVGVNGAPRVVWKAETEEEETA